MTACLCTKGLRRMCRSEQHPKVKYVPARSEASESLNLFYFLRMELCLVGIVTDFLPEFGLAWTEDLPSSSPTIFVSAIRDNKQNRHLKSWIHKALTYDAKLEINFYTSNRSLSSNLKSFLERGFPVCGQTIAPPLTVYNLKDAVEAEHDSISSQIVKTHLLPPLALKAGRLHSRAATTDDLRYRTDYERMSSSDPHQQIPCCPVNSPHRNLHHPLPISLTREGSSL